MELVSVICRALSMVWVGSSVVPVRRVATRRVWVQSRNARFVLARWMAPFIWLKRGAFSLVLSRETRVDIVDREQFSLCVVSEKSRSLVTRRKAPTPWSLTIAFLVLVVADVGDG